MDLNVNQVKRQIRKFRSVLCTRRILPCHAAYITSTRSCMARASSGLNTGPTLCIRIEVSIGFASLVTTFGQGAIGAGPSPRGPVRGRCPSNLGRSGHVHAKGKQDSPGEMLFWDLRQRAIAVGSRLHRRDRCHGGMMYERMQGF